jgi:hypothetical protein
MLISGTVSVESEVFSMTLNPLGAKIGKAADLVTFSVDKAIELFMSAKFGCST